ncbi:MAG: HEPN domain-containing protein [Ginsengibacter sp.]
MTEFKKEDYIKYRLAKADETLEAAEVLLRSKLWNSTVNRLYYSCYYAVNALLLQNEILAKSHTGVKSQFFLNFVKSGKIPKELGKLYADLFDARQKGDYNDLYDFEEQSATLLRDGSVKLILKIKELIISR